MSGIYYDPLDVGLTSSSSATAGLDHPASCFSKAATVLWRSTDPANGCWTSTTMKAMRGMPS